MNHSGLATISRAAIASGAKVAWHDMPWSTVSENEPKCCKMPFFSIRQKLCTAAPFRRAISHIGERHVKRAIFAAAIMVFTLASVRGDETSPQTADETAIREAVTSYVAAFNQGDARKLAMMWSPGAVYTNPLTDEQVVGRDAIEKQFSDIFATAKGAKLVVETESIRFLSPGVAVEHGSARILSPDQKSLEESQYTAIYVKQDGKWLLDRVTEEEVPEVTSNYEHLKDLEWMIGAWIDGDEESRVEMTYQWTKNRNFITCMFAVSVGDKIDMSGLQIIGWDPAHKEIRSWVFDSAGGFGQGVWNKKDKSWTIRLTGTLPDGSSTSSTHIITYLKDNAYGWQSVNRIVGGELQPNIDEVVAFRQTEAE